jgi:XRE family transcriptional regulator, regulator of sulfur utilization
MALSDQIRKHRLAKGLSLAELARYSKLSKGYLGQLEKGSNGLNPSVDVVYRIAFALGTSVSELLEKQIDSTDIEITEIPDELRKFALDEQLTDEIVKMLARIELQGRRPRTVKDWSYLYESIKRSVWLEDEKLQS